MRELSERTLWREIERKGARWGIFPVDDVPGVPGTMAAESFKVVRRIAPGLSVVTSTTRVICRINQRQRIQDVIRLRRGRGERGVRKRLALARDLRERSKGAIRKEVLDEFGADFRRVLRRTVQVWMGR